MVTEDCIRHDAGLFDFEVIINCIGKSDTRWCERPENWRETLLVNGVLPQKLSELCRRHGRKLVHISTGCLYDRNEVPQTENDFLACHCRYTVSKWVGENGLDPTSDLILRPRLFFNGENHPKNLLVKLFRFSAFLDERNSFTDTAEVVRATKALVEAGCVGPFNVACAGDATLHTLARRVGLDGPKIGAAALSRAQQIHLVNNVMDLSRVSAFYTPRDLIGSVLAAQARLNDDVGASDAAEVILAGARQ